MTIFDIFDVKIVFYGQKYVFWTNLSHIEYLLVNIFKKIRKRAQITQYLAVYTNFFYKRFCHRYILRKRAKIGFYLIRSRSQEKSIF